MEMVMDGDGRCNDNATAMTAMEGATATAKQRLWNVTMMTMDGAKATETATETATALAMATVMATMTAAATTMDGTMATATEDTTVTRQQRWRWMAPWRCNGGDCDGWRNGDGNGHSY